MGVPNDGTTQIWRFHTAVARAHIDVPLTSCVAVCARGPLYAICIEDLDRILVDTATDLSLVAAHVTSDGMYLTEEMHRGSIDAMLDHALFYVTDGENRLTVVDPAHGEDIGSLAEALAHGTRRRVDGSDELRAALGAAVDWSNVISERFIAVAVWRVDRLPPPTWTARFLPGRPGRTHSAIDDAAGSPARQLQQHFPLKDPDGKRLKTGKTCATERMVAQDMPGFGVDIGDLDGTGIEDPGKKIHVTGPMVLFRRLFEAHWAGEPLPQLGATRWHTRRTPGDRLDNAYEIHVPEFSTYLFFDMDAPNADRFVGVSGSHFRCEKVRAYLRFATELLKRYYPRLCALDPPLDETDWFVTEATRREASGLKVSFHATHGRVRFDSWYDFTVFMEFMQMHLRKPENAHLHLETVDGRRESLVDFSVVVAGSRLLRTTFSAKAPRGLRGPTYPLMPCSAFPCRDITPSSTKWDMLRRGLIQWPHSDTREDVVIFGPYTHEKSKLSFAMMQPKKPAGRAMVRSLVRNLNSAWQDVKAAERDLITGALRGAAFMADWAELLAHPQTDFSRDGNVVSVRLPKARAQPIPCRLRLLARGDGMHSSALVYFIVVLTPRGANVYQRCMGQCRDLLGDPQRAKGYLGRIESAELAELKGDT
jgi:hypothetical protein